MKKKLLLLMCCLSMGVGYAQTDAPPDTGTKITAENIINHRVLMGETVALLAKKYKITPQDIYEYNPDAVEGIGQNMFIKIPLHRQVDMTAPKTAETPIVYRKKPDAAPVKQLATTVTAPNVAPLARPQTVAAPQGTTASITTNNALQQVTHQVQSGETLTGLAKKYGTTIADIKDNNAGKLKYGLQTGQTLTIIPGAYIAGQNGVASHDVQPGETLFGLAHKYNVSVDQITAANPKTLKRGLQTGQTLKIPGALTGNLQQGIAAQQAPAPAKELIAGATEAPSIAQSAAAQSNALTDASAVEHKVASGETLTGLARKYNTTIDEITRANKSKLRHGLQAGQVITIKPNTSNY